MSHLSSADGDDQTFTNDQMAKFRGAVGEVQTLVGEKLPYVHVGASSGSLKVPPGVANAARIGLGLYGIQPFNEKSSYAEKLAALRPALRLVSKIISVKEIKKGDKVSYSGTFVADRDMRIGILPLGYYEGIDWRLSNRGVVEVNGSYARILGRVCMNVVVIDLTDIDAGWMDEVVVIEDEKDSRNSVEAISKTCETIPYDILVHLNESVRRVVG